MFGARVRMPYRWIYCLLVIWGAQDPALDMARFAPELCDALGLEAWHQVRGKHFLQEDAPAEIAQLIARYRDDAPP